MDQPPSTLVVTPEWMPRTDLASIPEYPGWFARRVGRHTPAAVVHDLVIPGAGRQVRTRFRVRRGLPVGIQPAAPAPHDCR